MNYLFNQYSLLCCCYFALVTQAYEVKENMIFYSELNVNDQAYKHLKYKRLMLAKLIKFY